jgi:hypothetical protein
VKVGDEDKPFTAEDVSNLIAKDAASTQKLQQVATVTKAAEKYGLEPDQLVDQAEGAFAVVSKLVNAGIINEEGEIVQKKEPDPLKPVVSDPVKPDPVTPDLESKIATVVEKTVEKALGGIPETVDAIKNDQARMIRSDLQKQAQDKYPDLTEDDVTKLFGAAMADRKKSFWQHAEEIAETRKTRNSEARAAHAKEFGIDLKKFDANKLNEQDSKGGPAAIIANKKISFKKGEKDSITPKQAMREHFARLHGQEG